MTKLLILLGIATASYLLYMIWKGQKQAESEEEDPKTTRFNKNELRLENVKKGGVIHLRNIGPDMEDLDVNIISKHIYRQDDYAWYELEGDSGDRKVWIEYEQDDELEISVTLKKMHLRDIGINSTDLEKIKDEEEGSILYEGNKFFYEDSDHALFCRDGDYDNAEEFFFWDFETDAGDKYISIEKWSENKTEVTYSVPIKQNQVTVYSLKA